jgi:hypothetical protein
MECLDQRGELHVGQVPQVKVPGIHLALIVAEAIATCRCAPPIDVPLASAQRFDNTSGFSLTDVPFWRQAMTRIIVLALALMLLGFSALALWLAPSPAPDNEPRRRPKWLGRFARIQWDQTAARCAPAVVQAAE